MMSYNLPPYAHTYIQQYYCPFYLFHLRGREKTLYEVVNCHSTIICISVGEPRSEPFYKNT